MILHGSSGVGEPKYAGGLAEGNYGGEYTGLGLFIPDVEPVMPPEPVELGLEYDPARVRYAAIPAWVIALGGLAALTWWIGNRL